MVYNIEIGLVEIGWVTVWIILAQDTDRWQALVNTAMNLNCREFVD
jgi:hypothetical protein